MQAALLTHAMLKGTSGWYSFDGFDNLTQTGLRKRHDVFGGESSESWDSVLSGGSTECSSLKRKQKQKQHGNSLFNTQKTLQ